MLSLAIFFSLFFSSVFGGGQLVIVQSPKSVEFSGRQEIDAQIIPDVLSASLGFTVRKESNWPNMVIKDPFGFAEAVVVVSVEGVSSLGKFESIPAFPISESLDEERTFSIVRDDIIDRYPTIDNSKIERIELGSELIDISNMNVSHLDKDNIEDASFLRDIEQINQIGEELKEKYSFDGIPSLTWIVLSSLHPLSDFSAGNSNAAMEATALTREAILNLGKSVNSVGAGKSLVVALVSDSAHTRHGRSVTDAAANTTVPENRATVYSESYPAIFNIILWFAVAFIFALLATSYFIATMDPGRDSIIYRMTSNRMKKDS